ncbi:MAG: hypothetical protein L0332_35230, partial [Chloroflexi bacterium]|nr:hypothetical protein [Chloroflexota bacterium]
MASEPGATRATDHPFPAASPYPTASGESDITNVPAGSLNTLVLHLFDAWLHEVEAAMRRLVARGLDDVPAGTEWPSLFAAGKTPAEAADEVLMRAGIS